MMLPLGNFVKIRNPNDTLNPKCNPNTSTEFSFTANTSLA